MDAQLDGAEMSAGTKLSPLRAARVEQVARIIAGYPNGMALIRDTYQSAHYFDGLTRSALDTAIDDLVAADRAELVGKSPLVVRLVREVAE
jgi:hypothetical protein